MLDVTKAITEAERAEFMEDNNLVLITGSGGKGGNWLGKLKVGTCFICASEPQRDQAGREHHNAMLNEYHVLHSDGNSVKLLSNLNDELNLWVDSVVFSNQFRLRKILGETLELSEGTLQPS